MNQSGSTSARSKLTVKTLVAIAFAGYFLGCGRIFMANDFVMLLTYSLLKLAAVFIFGVCVFKYYNHTKTKKFLTAVFALLSFLELWSAIESLIYRDYFCIAYFAGFLFFLLGSLSAAKGMKNKIFIRYALTIGIFLGFLSLYLVYKNIEFYKTYAMSELFFIPCNAIGGIAFYCSLFSYITDTEVFPDYKKFAKKMKSNSEEIEPKQALKVLKTKFERGIISEQEYKKEKTDILKKNLK